MAIQPLDQRLQAMISPEGEVKDELSLLIPAEPIAQDMPEGEDVQVAGLGTSLVNKFVNTSKVIKKGIASADALPVTEAEKELASQAQKAVQDAAIAAEKTTVPGAVQKVKQAVMARKPKKPAQEVQPTQPATQEQMQAAIQSAEQTVKLVDENVPGVFIAPADEMQTYAFLSGAETPAVGVDFNFNYIQAPEDIDKMIDATSRVFADSIDEAKRGVLKDEAVKDMAARLNIAPELLQMRIGDTLNAEQLLAARHLLVRSAANLSNLKDRIKAMPVGTEDDKLLLDFRNSLATHAAIQMRVKAAQTEAGRALRSFRLPVDGSIGLSDPAQINNLLEEMGGRSNLKNLALAYDKLTLDQQARFVDLAGSTSKQLGSIWQELMYSAMLTNPATLQRAAFGNLFMAMARPFDTAFAATVGRAVDKTLVTPLIGTKSQDEVFLSEAIIEMVNYFTSIPSALKTGFQAFKTDAPVYKTGRDLDKTPDPAISAKLFADPESPVAQGVDYVGKAVRLWSRGMLGIDEFSKAQLSVMETKRLAARDALIAMDNGVDVDKALDGMAMQIANPDVRVIERVDTAALEGTLQSDLGTIGQALNKIRNQLGPVGTVLAPFVKTVINSQKQMLARTPMGQLALKEIREDYAAGGARRQMAVGKASMGFSFMGLGYTLALNGTCTGAGPTDPARRKFLTETTGWQPFSCRTGTDENGLGIYRSYAGLEPIGGMLGMAATLAEIGAVYGKEDDDEWHDLLLYSGLLPFKYIGELPFMSQMAKFVEMVEQVQRDPKGDAANSAAYNFFSGIGQSMVGGVTPIPLPGAGGLRWIENMIDPQKRQVTPDPSMAGPEKYLDFMYRAWASKMPGLSSGTVKDANGNDIPRAAVARNLWGQEITTGEPDALSFVIPFNKKPRDLDEVEIKLLQIAKARQKMPVNKPEQVVANIRLTDAEYSDMLLLMNQVQIGGKPMYSAIASELTNPEFVAEMNRGAYEGIASKLSGIVSDYRDEAVKSPMFTSRYPDAASQIARNRELALQKYLRTRREPVLD